MCKHIQIIFLAFQVRKEKLGDRVTALQQLVSPFGKVLVRYIFLKKLV